MLSRTTDLVNSYFQTNRLKQRQIEMAVCVFFADLKSDNSETVSEDYKAWEVASMKEAMDHHQPEIRSRQFVHPTLLLDEFARQPPDVLMLTNHSWNDVPNRFVARLAKRISPSTYVVIVGPNPPGDPARQKEFVGANPNVDLYVFCEGESCAFQLIQSFLIASKSLKNARPQGIIKSLEQISRSIVLYQAVQCLDGKVGHSVRPRLELAAPNNDSACQIDIEQL
jgi:hypothetical protein